MRRHKQEKVRIIVAFGDIEGFTTFLDAVTNEAIELDPYMDEFDAIIQQEAKRTGFEFRDTGDGFMCVVDLQKNRAPAIAADVAVALWGLLKRMENLRESMGHPRWSGFRIVIASGYVTRKSRYDGTHSLRGRHMNLAHNMLNIARGHGIVAHQSFRALITDTLAKSHGIVFTDLPWPRQVPDSVPRKDANSLSVLTVKSRAQRVRDRRR